MTPGKQITARPKPVVLAILDGFGCGHGDAHDAVHLAHTPCLDDLFSNYPNAKINASEGYVGLPSGQMGNSEVGHMNIGAGRVVMQDLPRIDQAIANGNIQNNATLKQFITDAKKGTAIVHLMGLLSDGGVHAHQDHMAAMVKLFHQSGLQVMIHLFLDGRDTPPKSALDYLKKFEIDIQGQGSFATIGGRFFAMDRDKRWDRLQQAYQCMVALNADRINDAAAYIAAEYAAGKTDEFVTPAAFEGFQGMNDGDALFMCNFRSDRARQILTALLDKNFDSFARARGVNFAATLGMVEYSSALLPLIPAIFSPEPLHDILGDVVAKAGLTQLRIAETEKYAHVTFFFNGGREELYQGEDRILIQSPDVRTYDLKPEMSAFEVTDALMDAIENDRFDLIVVNYANTDMVGHTGDVNAAKKAVEAVDQCLSRLTQLVLKKNGALLITADHGNAEQMFDDDTGQAHTAHTLNVVPAILVANDLRNRTMRPTLGKLADIAPTILDFLQLPQPDAMTGASLLEKVE